MVGMFIYLIIICIVPHYTAEEIFYDDCSSLEAWTKTDISNVDWSESEIHNLSEETITNFECESEWCFQIDSGNLLTSSPISIKNYQNITLKYSIKSFWLDDIQNNDLCKIYYTQNDEDWTLLTNSTSNINNIWQTIIIPSLPVTESDNIKLRFYASSENDYQNDNGSDACFIDEIYIFGTHNRIPSMSGYLMVGIIIMCSIGFLLMICLCKFLSEHVDVCTAKIMDCIQKHQSVSIPNQTASKGDARNLSFLEEEEENKRIQRIRAEDRKRVGLHNANSSRFAEEMMRRQTARDSRNQLRESARNFYEFEMDQAKVDNLRNFNFALAGAFAESNESISVDIFNEGSDLSEQGYPYGASNSTLNLAEINEKLRYHIAGLRIQIPTNLPIEFEDAVLPTDNTQGFID